YLFYHEGDIRNAMELAVQATQFCEFKDWWWKVQLAKCYVSLNLVRDAEQQLRSALKQYHHVETFVRLARIYMRLDQPLSAQEICKAGLEVFPNDVTILTELARLHEILGDVQSSIKLYRNVVIEDAMNAEAIACIGVYHFYNNQPELALRYYRCLLLLFFWNDINGTENFWE
ncbi:Anaphase-promoting complex subunit 3 protein, partial [Oryctes borbonicus]